MCGKYAHSLQCIRYIDRTRTFGIICNQLKMLVSRAGLEPATR